MKNKLLSIDLSLNSTGFALRDMDTKALLAYGVIKPKGYANLTYPEQQLTKMREVAGKIVDIIKENQPSVIVIEEINGGGRSARISQKTLDGMHYILLDRIASETGLIKSVLYYDSDGLHGWRSKAGLNINLTDTDKLLNKTNKKLNVKLSKKNKIKPITKKTLSIRYVNKKFSLGLVESKGGDDDIADAIGLSDFFLDYVVR